MLGYYKITVHTGDSIENVVEVALVKSNTLKDVFAYAEYELKATYLDVKGIRLHIEKVTEVPDTELTADLTQLGG